MIRLETVRLRAGSPAGYPFSLPVFRLPFELSFTHPVTLLIGENGCGKSTFLDLVAAKAGLYRIAQEDALNAARTRLFDAAAPFVEAVFRPVKPKGFLFRASDFATYLRHLDTEKTFARAELARVADEYRNHSEYARMMAAVPAARTLAELDGLHGRDLAASSHGEAYLDFFASRLRGDQLVLLDEPETPLSIQNQLALLVLIDRAVANGCQFLIATHAPVLIGIPDADVVEFGPEGPVRTRFQDIGAIRLLKRYLDDREAFFARLRAEDD